MGRNDNSTHGVERTADVMFRNYDEARNWVDDADLHSTTLVLEDHFDGEHIATARVSGGSGKYTVTITNHEGEDSITESVVDATEVAEMMGGWRVAGRDLHTDTEQSTEQSKEC